MTEPILTKIEDGIAEAIRNIRKGDGYHFDWGSVNELDKSNFVYPACWIELEQEENNDEPDGAWSMTYLQSASFTIRVWTRLIEETAQPIWDINRELNMALDDLKRLFGINYHASDSCDLIMYRGMTREMIRTGDMFIPKSMVTRWRVTYSQDRTDPSKTSE